jgi:very-long-chain (3R)-3-hydroxyacyl-CoA dehydratase
MVTAWSFAEIIRYLHYATNLLNIKVPVLEWIRSVTIKVVDQKLQADSVRRHARYTAFYILYPVGAGSEATLIYFSAP